MYNTTLSVRKLLRINNDRNLMGRYVKCIIHTVYYIFDHTMDTTLSVWKELIKNK